MARPWMIVLALAPLVSTSSAAQAVEPFCRDVLNELKPKTFIAKEPLYSTKVAADGIVDLERDKQEIRKGAKLKVVDIECEKSKLELTAKPLVGGEKVEIAFFLSV